MRKFALAMLVLLAPAFTPVFADIVPDEEPGVNSISYSDAAAKDLYEALNVPSQKRQTRAGLSDVKVFRADDGRFQVRCARVPVPNANDTSDRDHYYCTVETSTNGKALPKFPSENPRIRG